MISMISRACGNPVACFFRIILLILIPKHFGGGGGGEGVYMHHFVKVVFFFFYKAPIEEYINCLYSSKILTNIFWKKKTFLFFMLARS